MADIKSLNPNQPMMQAMIINSLYSEQTEPDDEDLVSLEDINLEDFDFSDGIDRMDEDERGEKEWEEKGKYALDHLDDFLLYINPEWP